MQIICFEMFLNEIKNISADPNGKKCLKKHVLLEAKPGADRYAIFCGPMLVLALTSSQSNPKVK